MTKTKLTKTKILLTWNSDKGCYDKFILIQPMNQNDRSEDQYVASQYVGTSKIKGGNK